MPRMLGRFCARGCACRDCGNGQPCTRWRKRVERREAVREIREWADDDGAELERVHLRPVTDAGDTW